LDSLSADGQQSVFAVLENDVTAQDGFGGVFRVSSDTGSVTNRRPHWFVNLTGALNFSVDSASGYQNSDREYRLYSHIMNNDAGGTSTIHRDGTQVDTRSITLDTNTTFESAKLAGVTSNATGSLYMSEVIYYPSDQSDNRTAIEANIGETYGITDIPAADDTVNGFVQTWYDQSGEGNDATQDAASSQPKIVDGGVLVTNDEGNPAIQGATGKSFGLSAIRDLEDVSIFFIGSVPSSFQAITGWVNTLHMIRFSSSFWEFVANLVDPGNMDWNSALTSGDTALFNFTRSSGTVTGYANSVASDTTSNANSNLFSLDRIFTRSNVTYNDYQGKASELIIYDSDQSANRPAIETNIANQYGITLS
jgi:hypothetical protein